MYNVSAPNNPYFQKKGDSKLSVEGDVFFTYSGSSFGGSLQGAYAFSNHFAGAYSLDLWKDNYKYTEYKYDFVNVGEPFIRYTSIDYNRNFNEFALGYFVALNSKKTNYFNIYCGYGVGSMNFKQTGSDTSKNLYYRYFQTNLNKVFIQPSFNFQVFKGGKISFISKFTWLNFNQTSSDYTEVEKGYYFLNLNNKNLYIGVEPTMLVSVGDENFQFIGSLSFNSLAPKPGFVATPWCISGGVSMDIIHLLKRK